MKIGLAAETTTKEYSVEKCILFQKGSEREETVLYTEDLSVSIDKSNSVCPIAKVLRNNVKKDGVKHPQNPIEYYFIKTGVILNDLVLQLTPDGRIDKVVNRDEIQKKWADTKIYLDNYFVSEDENVDSTIKGWTKQIGAVVGDEKLLANTVENDFLYNCYFRGFWMDYGTGNKMVSNRVLPGIFGAAETVLSEILTVTEENGTMQLTIVGGLNVSESDTDSIASAIGIDVGQVESTMFDFHCTYTFDKSGLIEKMEVTADINMSDPYQQRRYSLKMNQK